MPEINLLIGASNVRRTDHGRVTEQTFIQCHFVNVAKETPYYIIAYGIFWNIII